MTSRLFFDGFIICTMVDYLLKVLSSPRLRIGTLASVFLCGSLSLGTVGTVWVVEEGKTFIKKGCHDDPSSLTQLYGPALYTAT